MEKRHGVLKRFGIFFLVLVFGVGLLAGCGGQKQQTNQNETKQEGQKESAAPAKEEAKIYKITLAGASPGGLWSLIGEGVSKALAEEFPGSTVTYETSGGGFANIPMVANGDVELGLAQGGEVKAAVEGWEPFKEPISDVRAIAVMYDWQPRQIIIRKEVAEKYGITSLDDIVAKKIPLKIAVNQKGNLDAPINEDLLRLYGMPVEEIEKWGGQILYSPSAEAASLIKDRRSDMNMVSVFEKHSSIMEIAQSVDVDMLSVKDSVIEELDKKWGAGPWTIKAGTYDWLDHDVKTTTMTATILVNKDLSEDEVYDITKALVENIAAIQGVHGAMKALTPELMTTETQVPYHPGAIKYFKEKGLM